ncbi:MULTISPECIES: cyclase family protein [Streptomyces]|uniref:Cyclase n=3 Tax=Streptomyces TaxID=1883 RepID=A0A8H9LQB7_9ACTN|nr:MULTISPECIES: cyclase family protein [Streptomyces]NEE23885.1 cyclase family protein [Streptomyces sp. SID7982]NEE45019.1 cyclase family protein [Streptomyces sp. SID8455]NEC13826.1 cyclase family protein [Streptomyces sp. SID8014]RPK88842.1 Kynurenine formamidase [Streptomyces sp. ADI98-12]SUO94199.1 cyclase [Streptomyces griseus]
MTTAKRDLVDLSHVVRQGMTTYPGLPGPVIEDHMSRVDSRDRYSPGTEFQIGRITLVANTGTYADVPFHRFEGGADLSQVPLSRFVDLEGVAVSVPAGSPSGVGPEVFDGLEVTDRAVLVHTGWDRHWATPSYGDPAHPFLTEAAVAWLVARRPALVGIDSVNIDDMADLARPAHTGLLAAGIPVVEHMTGLGQVVGQDFRFHAAPIPVADMGTFPVRAYALVDREG